MFEVFPSGCSAFDFLKPALEQTFKIIDDFVGQYAGMSCIQLPYGTNERATLSLFAGGIWRSDPSNLALEEYSCVKGGSDGRWKGRRDLWFRVNQEACFAEAKQDDWPCAAKFNNGEAARCMRRTFREAMDALRDSENSTWLQTHPGEQSTAVSYPKPPRCFGIAFVVPYLYMDQREANERIMNAYAQTLRAAAERIVEEEKCRILWGRYYRPRLLEQSKFFASRWLGKWTSMPELDILICESTRTAD